MKIVTTKIKRAIILAQEDLVGCLGEWYGEQRKLNIWVKRTKLGPACTKCGSLRAKVRLCKTSYPKVRCANCGEALAEVAPPLRPHCMSVGAH